MVKILVVEDSVSVSNLLKVALPRYFPEAEFFFASNFEEAMNTLEKHRPELVLSDNDFPRDAHQEKADEGMGILFAGHVFAKHGETTPFILMSGRGLPNPLPAGVGWGIQKPFTMDGSTEVKGLAPLIKEALGLPLS